jgi:hypothetical protein
MSNLKLLQIMKYKIIERVNPAKPDEAKKQYASTVNVGMLNLKDIAKEIAGRLCPFTTLRVVDNENKLKQTKI